MKLKLITTWTLALMLMAGMSGCAFINKIKAKDHLNRAVAAYNQGNYDESVALLEQAIALDPTLPQLKPYYGAALYAKYNLGGEEEYAHKSLDVYTELYQEEMQKPSPDEQTVKNAVAYIAAIYNSLGNEDEYRKWMMKRLDLPGMTPEDKAEIYYSLATALWNDAYETTQRYLVHKGSQAIYEVPEEEVPKVRDTANKGLELIEKALELKPEYGDALSYKNLLLRELAKVEKDPEVKKALIEQADEVRARAMEVLQREKEEKQAQPATVQQNQ